MVRSGGGRWHIGSDNFTNSSKIPRFAHLLYSYQELYEILKTNYDPNIYDFYQISKLILNGSKEANLNHLFLEDYRFFFGNSQFKEKKFSVLSSVQLTEDEKKALGEKYPNSDNAAVSICFLGKK